MLWQSFSYDYDCQNIPNILCKWFRDDLPPSVDTSVSFELYGHLVGFRLEDRGHHGLIAAIFPDFVRSTC